MLETNLNLSSRDCLLCTQGRIVQGEIGKTEVGRRETMGGAGTLWPYTAVFSMVHIVPSLAFLTLLVYACCQWYQKQSHDATVILPDSHTARQQHS